MDVGLDATELTRAGLPLATEKLISFFAWRTDLSSFRSTTLRCRTACALLVAPLASQLAPW